jgi:hypothetical protein
MLSKSFLQYRGKLGHILAFSRILALIIVFTHIIACFIMYVSMGTEFKIASIYKASMGKDDTKKVEGIMTE